MKINWLVTSLGGAIGLVVIIALGWVLPQGSCRDFKQGQIRIADQVWPVAMATTDKEQSRGLGGCKAIPTRSGMYFPYNQAITTSFWMKGMVIPIDIIWITDNRVIGIESHVQPVAGKDTELPRYNSPRPVTAVLEVGAGEALRQDIKVGTVITAVPK
jgi:uncharacterized protein